MRSSAALVRRTDGLRFATESSLAYSRAPTIQQILERISGRLSRLRIDSAHDVPYGAGADEFDPCLVHIDWRVPKRIVVDGMEIDPRIVVAHHELAEKEGMVVFGLPYEFAHVHYGVVAERLYLEKIAGAGAWKSYNDHWGGWLAHIEKEIGESSYDLRPPSTLYLGPYPPQMQKKLRAAGVRD